MIWLASGLCVGAILGRIGFLTVGWVWHADYGAHVQDGIEIDVAWDVLRKALAGVFKTRDLDELGFRRRFWSDDEERRRRVEGGFARKLLRRLE